MIIQNSCLESSHLWRISDVAVAIIPFLTPARLPDSHKRTKTIDCGVVLNF